MFDHLYSLTVPGYPLFISEELENKCTYIIESLSPWAPFWSSNCQKASIPTPSHSFFFSRSFARHCDQSLFESFIPSKFYYSRKESIIEIRESR